MKQVTWPSIAKLKKNRVAFMQMLRPYFRIPDAVIGAILQMWRESFDSEEVKCLILIDVEVDERSPRFVIVLRLVAVTCSKTEQTEGTKCSCQETHETDTQSSTPVSNTKFSNTKPAEFVESTLS